MKVYRARFETRNFTFEAYAESAAAAQDALHRGILKHTEQYGLREDWHLDRAEDITVGEIACGACYRDREVLTPSPSGDNNW